jgi:hypothetical protein
MGGLNVKEVRRRQSLGGRIGAAKKYARFGPPDPWAPTKARRVYRESFEVAHGGDPTEYADLPRPMRPVGLCRACPDRIVVPEAATPEQRREFAAHLRAMHYGRLALRAVAKRRATR